MIKIVAYQIAESIDIKKLRKEYAGKEHYYTSSEVFYESDNEERLYIFSFGVVVYTGYDEIKQSQFNEYVMPFCKNSLAEKLTEEFIVHEDATYDRFGHNEIFLSKFDLTILRIIMLNVGQSVALDYFSQQTDQLLQTTNEYTLRLEKHGKLDITNKKLLQFIGKTLNVKNRIVDSLYIIVSPDDTWDDEYLHKIDTALRNTFDLNIRFKDIDYSLQIIKENLELFRDLMQHRKSTLLEIIIIALIMVEVLDLLIDKIAHFF